VLLHPVIALGAYYWLFSADLQDPLPFSVGTVSCLALLGSWTNDFSKKKSWTNHIAELSVKFCLKKSKYTLWFQTEEIIFFLIFLTNFLFFARKSKKEFI